MSDGTGWPSESACLCRSPIKRLKRNQHVEGGWRARGEEGLGKGFEEWKTAGPVKTSDRAKHVGGGRQGAVDSCLFPSWSPLKSGEFGRHSQFLVPSGWRTVTPKSVNDKDERSFEGFRGRVFFSPKA